MTLKILTYSPLLATLLAVVCLSGCDNDDSHPDITTELTGVDLAFSLNSTPARTTRMGVDVVQAADGSFRGLQDVYILPFTISGSKVGAADRPKAFIYGGIDSEYLNKSASNFYYYDRLTFITGINAFICYARARTAGDKAVNGSLVVNYPDGMSSARGTVTLDQTSAITTMSEFTFAPDQIYASDVAPTEASSLAAYLTYISQATATVDGTTTLWSTTSHSQLHALFLNFVNMTNTLESNIMAGSSVNLLRHVTTLQSDLEAMQTLTDWDEPTVWTAVDKALVDDIADRILHPSTDCTPEGFVLNGAGDAVTSLGDYPLSYDLPDGAAVLLWTGSRFEPQLSTTTVAPINAIQRFAYPAELYYYTNSLIKTTNKDDIQSFYRSESTWDDVLSQYENDNTPMSNQTKGAAVKEPMQYAVCDLQVCLNKVATTYLNDANGQKVPVGTGDFKLTGVIVGSQRKVGFDFCPTTTSDVDVRFIYDSKHPDIYLSTTVEQSEPTHTLVLQNADDEPVYIILEFLNGGETTFRGIGGVVYPGTKFYLVAQVKPEERPEPDTRDDINKRVFTQDYTTTVGMTVVSLAKAYNVLPDILSPRLEIGIEAMPWQEATPGNVPLD